MAIEDDILAAVQAMQADVTAIKSKTDLLNITAKVYVSGFVYPDDIYYWKDGTYEYDADSGYYQYDSNVDNYIVYEDGVYKIKNIFDEFERFWSCATLYGTYVVDPVNAQGWENEVEVTNASVIESQLSNDSIQNILSASPRIIDQRVKNEK